MIIQSDFIPLLPHEMPSKVDISNTRISSTSVFTDRSWRLPDHVAGNRYHSFYFARISGRWSNVAKAHVLSALIDSNLLNTNISTISRRCRGLSVIFDIVDAYGLARLADADQSFVEFVLSELEEEIADGRFQNKAGEKAATDRNVTGDASYSTLTGILGALKFMLEQSDQLRASGFDALPAGLAIQGTVEGCVKRLTSDCKLRTAPLPDEVADAVLTAAGRLLDAPADDVINALTAFYNEVPLLKKGAWRRSPAEPNWSSLSDGSPWHGHVNATSSDPVRSVSATIRRAMQRVVSACDIVLMMSSGVRPSEYLGAVGGRDPASGLPAAITSRLSRSRLFELFFLQSSVSKHTAEPGREEWLIGSRAIGDHELPPAVRAIDALDQIYTQLRRVTKPGDLTGHLTLAVAGRCLPIKPTSLSPRLSFGMRTALREFISGEIDWDVLSDTGRSGKDLRSFKADRGRNIKPTHFRKTFVAFFMRADPSLRSALARHLKHVSNAILDEHYLPNDLSLVAEVNEARTYELARLVVAMVRGEEVSGPSAERLREQFESMRELLNPLDDNDAIDVVHERLRVAQLGVHVVGPFKCLVELWPSSAICHKLAGTKTWLVRKPDLAFRTEKNCSICHCGVRDRETAAEMTGRYVAARRVELLERKRADAEGDGFWQHEQRVVIARARLAKRILEEMNLSVPGDELIE